MISSKTLLFASLFLVSVGSRAQHTNFAGEWKYKGQTNLSGRSDPSDFSWQISVWQTPQSITVANIVLNRKFDHSMYGYNDLMSFDGKPGPGIIQLVDLPDQRKRITQMTWDKDQTGFTYTTRVYTPSDTSKMTVRVTDTWSMTGHVLIVQRKRENFVSGEIWEASAAYDKVQDR